KNVENESEKIGKIAADKARIEIQEPGIQSLNWERELRGIANSFAILTIITLVSYLFVPSLLIWFLAALFTVAAVGLIFLQRQISFIARETEKTIIGGNIAIAGLFILESPLLFYIVNLRVLDTWKLLLMITGGILFLMGSFVEATSYDEFITRYIGHNKLHSFRVALTAVIILLFLFFPAVAVLLFILAWIDKFLLIFYKLFKWLASVFSSLFRFIATKTIQGWNFLLDNKLSFFRLTLFSVGIFLLSIAILTDFQVLSLLSIIIAVIIIFWLSLSEEKKISAANFAVLITFGFSLITGVFGLLLIYSTLGQQVTVPQIPQFPSAGWLLLITGILISILAWIDRFLLKLYAFFKWLASVLSSLFRFITTKTILGWNFLLDNKLSFFRLILFSAGSLLLSITILSDFHSLSLLNILLVVIIVFWFGFSKEKKANLTTGVIGVIFIFSLFTGLIGLFATDLEQPFPAFPSAGWLMFLAGILIIILPWLDFIIKTSARFILGAINTTIVVFSAIFGAITYVFIIVNNSTRLYAGYARAIVEQKPWTVVRHVLFLSGISIPFTFQPYNLFLPIIVIISLIVFIIWLRNISRSSSVHNAETKEEEQQQAGETRNYLQLTSLAVEKGELGSSGMLISALLIISTSTFILQGFIQDVLGEAVLLAGIALITVSLIDYIAKFLHFIVKMVIALLKTIYRGSLLILNHFKLVLPVYAKITRNMILTHPGRYIKGTGTTFAITLLLYAISIQAGFTYFGIIIFYSYGLLVLFIFISDTSSYRSWLKKQELLEEDKTINTESGVEEEQKKLLLIIFWDPMDFKLPRDRKFNENTVFIVPAWILVCTILATLFVLPTSFLLDILGDTAYHYGVALSVLAASWIVEIYHFAVKTIRWLVKKLQELLTTIYGFTRRHSKRITQTSLSCLALIVILAALFIEVLESSRMIFYFFASLILIGTWIYELIAFMKLAGKKTLETITRMVSAAVELISRVVAGIKAGIRALFNALYTSCVRVYYFSGVFIYFLVDYLVVYLINLLAIGVFIFGIFLIATGLLPDNIRIELIEPLIVNNPLNLVYGIFSPSDKADPGAYKLVDLLVGLGMVAVPAWIVYITITRRNRLKIPVIERPRRPLRIGGIDFEALRNALESGSDLQPYLTGKYPAGTLKEIISILGEYKKYNLVTDFLNSGNFSITAHSQEILFQGLPNSTQDLLEHVFDHPMTAYLAVEVLIQSDNPSVAEYLAPLVAKNKIFLPFEIKREVEEYLRRSES
ncbi:MAG: hypothetical protein ACFFD4_27925, partial [Candidatus Odinarchaeota archaeon]